MTSTVEQINAAHQAVIAAGNAGLEHAIEAGKLLNIMFEKVKAAKEGKWADWLKTNCPKISDRTDSDYRNIAKNETAIKDAVAKDRSSAAKSIRWALRLIAKPRQSGKKTPNVKSSAVVTPTPGSPDLADLLSNVSPDEVLIALKEKWEPEQIKRLAELIDGGIPTALNRRPAEQSATH
jgi:hypothetical protein